jgi:hypothetical protein
MIETNRNKNQICRVFSGYLAWCGIIVYNDGFEAKREVKLY